MWTSGRTLFATLVSLCAGLMAATCLPDSGPSTSAARGSTGLARAPRPGTGTGDTEPRATTTSATAAEPGTPPDERLPTIGDRLVIDSRTRTLTVYAGDRVLRTFPVGLARGGVGKVKRGDLRNPLGTYRLMKGRASKFHRFLPVSYPNAEDAARGLKAGLISKAQAKAIVAATRNHRMPPQDTALGGAIGIHGLGMENLGALQALHRYFDASEGCFVLTDEEVVELERLYEPGAVLELR